MLDNHLMQLSVATIAGAHGLKGMVKLILHTDDPELRFQPGVILDTDSDDYPELEIRDVRHQGASWQVAFEEVADRTGAEALRGTELFIETDEWESDDDEYYLHELINLPVVGVDGIQLGTVEGFESGIAQDLLLVATEHGTVRVPFVTALVPEVTREKVVVDPPRGLFPSADDPISDDANDPEIQSKEQNRGNR